MYMYTGIRFLLDTFKLSNLVQTLIEMETRGPWATSLTWENSSNSIKTYDYIITLIKGRKNPLSLFLGFVKPWVPFIQGCFVPNLMETGPVVLKKILKVGKCISIILILSPLEKNTFLLLNKVEFPLHKYALC